jgi:drug/metabolite transporter (DMT)-like permease
MQMATGSQVGAGVVLLPFLPLVPIQGEITTTVAIVSVALALLCSAVAYLIYFRLMADVGPSKALTVTFLIPLFALLWGYLFLHESITLNTAIGCAFVVLATWLVVFQPVKK